MRLLHGTHLLIAAIVAIVTPAAAGAAGRPAVHSAAKALAAAPRGLQPSSTSTAVDYLRDIHPLLQSRCGSCHLNGSQMGGLSLASRDLVLKGGNSGPAAVSGKPNASLLIKLVSGADPARKMPATGPALTPGQVALLARWIQQGLPFAGAAAGSFPEAPLQPRTVALPPERPGLSNPIDRILSRYFVANHVTPGSVVSDRLFARRAYLDLIGLLPSTQELDAFIADRQPNKRALLVDQLLSNRQEYATHWLSFWNDMLRNDYAGTGYIDGGRKTITRWLFNALYNDLPYDEFVRQLVNPGPDSEGFVKGIVWRGTVNASQTPPMQAAQGISQVFLGINLKCASCHDSFISRWKLTDSYGLAGVYADQPLETVRCDKPTGKIAAVRFLYPGLGAIDGAAPRQQRLAQLAAAITSPQDGRLTRTLVNRLWGKLMGRGLVEPQDEMDRQPWSPDVLDFLAEDLRLHNYDVKHTLQLIVTSRAYSLPSMELVTDRPRTFVFTGPVVKRMSAEQLIDAVYTVTDAWPTRSDAGPLLSGAEKPLTAHWIWNDAHATSAAPGARVYFRKTFTLAAAPARAIVEATCDNEFTLYVNGRKMGGSDNWMKPTIVDMAAALHAGQNLVAVEGINWPDPVTGKGKDVASGPNPAGFFLQAEIQLQAGSPTPATSLAPTTSTVALRTPAPPTAGETVTLGSDASWLCSDAPAPGWESAAAPGGDWKPASELGGPNTGPWTAGAVLASTLAQAMAPGPMHIRAALEKADVLMVALGRPNREQVVTERATVATTLEALELSNGRTLSGLLQTGADHWLSERAAGETPPQLVTRIFRRALGRSPTPAELTTALAITGTPPTRDGVEDLLWTVTMLPEFQLVR